MPETYFITGAQGCIGSWIVKALAERGDSIEVFDRSDDARRLSAIMRPDDLNRVRFVMADITDAGAVRAAVRAIHRRSASSIWQACKCRPARRILRRGPS